MIEECKLYEIFSCFLGMEKVHEWSQPGRETNCIIKASKNYIIKNNEIKSLKKKKNQSIPLSFW